MDFFADVFGTIASSGGTVHLHANLSGGHVTDPGGVVQIDGRTSRAIIEARQGEIQGNHAEGATLVAGKVILTRAISCDIVADEVEIGEATGCTVAARRIRIDRASAKRSEETLIGVCVPDFTEHDKVRAGLEQESIALRQRLAEAEERLQQREGAADVRAFVTLEHGVRDGTVKLSAEQAEKWRLAMRKIAGPLAEIAELRKGLEAKKAKLAELAQRTAELDSFKAAAGQDLSCSIAQVLGDTTVQTLGVNPTGPVFADVAVSNMKVRLRDTRNVRDRLFSGDSGQFAWSAQPPPASDADGADRT